jgi:hypothetical protein
MLTMGTAGANRSGSMSGNKTRTSSRGQLRVRLEMKGGIGSSQRD